MRKYLLTNHLWFQKEFANDLIRYSLFDDRALILIILFAHLHKMQFFHFYLIIHCLFLFLQPTTFVVNAAEVPKIIVLPEKSSHFSKYVPEGEEGNASKNIQFHLIF